LHAEGASFLEQKYNAGNLKEFSVAVRTFMNDHNTENLTPTAALERMRALSESDAKAFVDAHGGASTWEKLAKHVETFHAGQADPEAVADATSTMENISGAEKAWREIPLSERSGAEHWEVMTDRFDVGPGVEFHADQYGVWQNVDVKMDSDLTLHVSYDGGSETIVAPEQKLMNMEWMKAQLADVGKSVQAKYDRFVSFTKVTPGGSVHKDDFLGKPIDATMDRTTRALDVKWGNDRYHIPRPEKVAEFRASAQ
jgi:hypothetical protein